MTTLTISKTVADAAFAAHPDLEPYNQQRYWRETEVNSVMLSDEALAVLRAAAAADGDKTDKKVAALIDLILSARAGDNSPVKSLPALAQVMQPWVERHCANGWLVSKNDGYDRYWLVTDASHREADTRGGSASTSIVLVANSPGHQSEGRGNNSGRTHSSLHFDNDDMFTTQATSKRRRRTVAELLESKGYFAATEADVDAHDQMAREYESLLSTGFASQYLHVGSAQDPDSPWKAAHTNHGAKVIHDIAPSERVPAQPVAVVWGSGKGPDAENAIVGKVPTLPTLRVFDLPRQVFATVDARDLSPYVYDQELREKLVLPKTHRRLLDVLTTNLADYSDDIIDGKSAGNVILAQGRPGLGKTLTAEVYAELVRRPLYSIHSGSLGTTAKDVRENLEAIFARAARWDAVLLLDEADVFVIERGQSVEQNAIVAEFLRTLEYFKGLLFMTTNRSDAIDDAILSRCAAIIAYSVPGRDAARRVWDVMVAQQAQAASKQTGKPVQPADLVSDDLIETLLDTYPHLAPRDIKMVLRLALRIAASENRTPNLADFEECILFRGLT